MIDDVVKQEYALLGAFDDDRNRGMTREEIRERMRKLSENAFATGDYVDAPLRFNRILERAISDDLVERISPSRLTITEAGLQAKAYKRSLSGLRKTG